MGWNPLKRIAVVYYYFFLVYAVGLSSLSSCSSDTPDDQGVEDLDDADADCDYILEHRQELFGNKIPAPGK